MTINVNEDDFGSEVLNSSKPVLVDFWAEWCGPCRQLAPTIDQISNEMFEKLKVVKVNIDNNPDCAQKYGVRGIPTMILFKDGKAVDTKVGALPKSSIAEWLFKHIS